MNLSVRKARVEHTGAVQELYETLFPADGPFKAWATPDVIWFVALDDKKVVGFAGVRFIRRSKTAELVISGVATTHQGRGIQRRLISARERAARKVGMTRAVSYTIPQNAPSATNLAKRGYSTYRPKTAWSGRRSVVYWEKRL